MIRAAYVHVPFCVHRCGYCDFTVLAGRDDLQQEYLRALRLELSGELQEPQPVQTLFIGGGTPTYLPPPLLEQLLQLLREWLPLEAGGEYSVEANPEGFCRERMQLLREYGVNRVSLGVQSLHAPTLQILERSHRPEDVARVCHDLRSAGHTNLAIDLIYGVPGLSLTDWERTLRAAVELAPQHVSTYGLTFEKGTTFWGRLLRGDLSRPAEELEREMYALGMELLPAAGYQQYELSNFARPGFACRHNQVYWRQEPYYGFGPGAAGFDGQTRRLRHRSVTTWIRRTQQGASPFLEVEQLTPELLASEGVLLGLRQIAGIELQEFEQRHQRSLRSLNPAAYDRWLRIGWLEEVDGSVRLTHAGRFVADTVVAEFIADQEC